MNKEEIIEKYGVEAYEKKLQQGREWNGQHPEEKREQTQEWKEKHPEQVKEVGERWRKNNPEKVKVANQEISRKGGKHYERHCKYFSTGIPHERKLVRMKHAKHYQQYKTIIAPDSQIHHEWIPETADFRGVALVETDQHMHGFVDVIQILEGEITLLTEAEVRAGEAK